MAAGDQIYITQYAGQVPFQHHGIDMGDGTVVHLAPEEGGRWAWRDESQRFSVRRDSMQDFCRGQTPVTVSHANRLSVAKTLERAQELVGRSGYSLLENNCEHLATSCVTGTAHSPQIELSVATVNAATSLATKALWSAGGRLGLKSVMRGAAKTHPAALLADGVEIATLAIGCRQGMSAQSTKRLATASGLVAAAGVGAVLGGPAGATAGVALHASSKAIAERLTEHVKQFLK